MSADFGHIVVAAGGVYSSKPRPVLVFQNSTHSTGQSTVVIPFTSEHDPTSCYRVAVGASAANGLGRDCWLEIDKLGAIRTSWIGGTIGALESEPLRAALELAHRLMSPASGD